MTSIEYMEKAKPDKWPANGREGELQAIDDAIIAFDNNPNYLTKERLISLLNYYDTNQSSNLGIQRVTDYEVTLINSLYLWGLIRQLPSLHCFLLHTVGRATEMQKQAALIKWSMGIETEPWIREYEKCLVTPIKLYYCAYQDYIIKNDKPFAEQIIETIKHEIEGINCSALSDNVKRQARFEISKGYTLLLVDISFFYSNKNERLWQFTREELLRLFSFEAELFMLTDQQASRRPLQSELITQISNYILKSRYDYNSDYICKYVSEDVAKKSVINHEIWMKSIEKLNDKNEGDVVRDIFSNREWIEVDWVGELQFNRTRQYYVSSFSKTFDNNDMKEEYGSVVYGYKGDKIADLISPLFYENPTDLSANEKANKEIKFSLVTCFDMLYDVEELKKELNYLFSVIDVFFADKANKNEFLNTILQYWILSAKEPKWEPERERRYVIFLYDSYIYPEMKIEDGYHKIKTSLFLYPDFLLGPHRKKEAIISCITSKKWSLSHKPYLYCHNCLNRDYDAAAIGETMYCPICKGTIIEIINPLLN